MNDVTDMKIACTPCECAEFPPATIHDEDDIRMTVILNATSKSEFQEPDIRTLDIWKMSPNFILHAWLGTRALSQPNFIILVFAFADLDL